MFAIFESENWLVTASPTLREGTWRRLPVSGNRRYKRQSKYKDNADKHFHLPRCKWTGDDTATVFGICVSLLIVLAGALGYIFCVSLLLTLMRVFVPLGAFLKMQVCP